MRKLFENMLRVLFTGNLDEPGPTPHRPMTMSEWDYLRENGMLYKGGYYDHNGLWVEAGTTTLEKSMKR